ncbi:MAG: biliverdin-producing heme oxygenase [Desulfococcaceae bacterium]
MASPLFRRLKTAIQPYHDAAEAEGPLHRLLLPDFSLSEYVAVLKRLYGFLCAAEPAAAAALATALSEADTRKLWRLPHLAADLSHFGVTAADLEILPVCPDPPTFPTASRAVGWFYLSEGSRLGGQVLAGGLKERLGLGPETGAAYFGSRGENPGHRWRRFQSMADQLISPQAQQETIAAACDCFDQLNRWLADRPRHA